MRIGRAYDGFLTALAAVAAAILGLSALLITFDVVLRASGWQPPAHTVSLTEYGLLYATLLGAPWLLRHHGHVHVEVVVTVLPEGLRRLAESLVCLVCCAACLVVVWAAGGAMLDNFARGSFDMRSFDMPKWLLYAPFPLSFAMMAGEFLRFLWGRDSLYADAPDAEGRV